MRAGPIVALMGSLRIGVVSFVTAFAATALAAGCNVSGTAAPGADAGHTDCTNANGEYMVAHLGCRDNAIATCQMTETCDQETEECTNERIVVQLTPCPADRSLCVDQGDAHEPASVCQVASLDRTCTAKLGVPDGFDVALIADLDHDGRSDLIGFGNAIAMGQADGSYRILRAQTPDVGVTSRLGDFDGDGNLDLMGADYHLPPGPITPDGATYSLTLARGRGDGTFDASKPVPQWAENADPIAVLDVNGDKKDDLVGFDPSARAFFVLLGGAVTMTALPPQRLLIRCAFDECPDDTKDYRAGDFDKDGFGDFVFFEGQDMLVLFGSASGVLRRGPPVPVMPPKDLFGPVIPADMDGDGVLDLVVRQQGTAWLHRGHGDGTFDPEVEVSAAPYGVPDPSSGEQRGLIGLLVADLDDDGVLDVVMDANPVDHVLVIRKGTGGGKFAAPTFYQPSVENWILLGALTPSTSHGRDLLVSPFVIPAACRR